MAGHRGTAAGLLLGAIALLSMAPFLAPAQADFREINIVDDEFEPASVTVRKGDTVVWVHRGQRPHGVRATDGSFDSSPGCSFQNGGSCMRSGDRYSRTFDKAGTFSYFCPVHGSANGVGMAGQVTVADSGGGGGTTTTTTRPPATTTTARPATTTTRAPATTTQAPPAGSPTTNTTAPPPGTDPAPPSTAPEGTVITVPATGTSTTDTTLVAAPVGDPDDGNSALLIGLAVAVVLAAAVGATAWYYRPANRPPGAPPAI